MFCSRQMLIRLLSISITFCQIFSLVCSSLSPYKFRETLCGFEIYYQRLIVKFLSIKESIECAFFKLPRHQVGSCLQFWLEILIDFFIVIYEGDVRNVEVRCYPLLSNVLKFPNLKMRRWVRGGH